jgi:hypothetical protein
MGGRRAVMSVATRCAQQAAGAGGDGLVGGGEGVGVDARCHGRVGVAQAAGDGSHLVPADGDGGHPMAEVVQAPASLQAHQDQIELEAQLRSIRRPEMARAITSCWISLVPSKIVWIRLSGSAGVVRCFAVRSSRG